MQSRPPATILTGFLGAGKTTLLNRILEGKAGKKIAVIVNEFGEIGIDHQLVVRSDEEIIELNNGCLCCTVRGDLIRIVDEIFERYDNIDHLVIETTGLADPGPVIQSFMVDDRMQSRLIAGRDRHRGRLPARLDAAREPRGAGADRLRRRHSAQQDRPGEQRGGRPGRAPGAGDEPVRPHLPHRAERHRSRSGSSASARSTSRTSSAWRPTCSTRRTTSTTRRVGSVCIATPGRGRRHALQQVDVRPGPGARRRPVPDEGHPRPGCRARAASCSRACT